MVNGREYNLTNTDKLPDLMCMNFAAKRTYDYEFPYSKKTVNEVFKKAEALIKKWEKDEWRKGSSYYIAKADIVLEKAGQPAFWTMQRNPDSSVNEDPVPWTNYSIPTRYTLLETIYGQPMRQHGLRSSEKLHQSPWKMHLTL
jgi:hypothetical protein